MKQICRSIFTKWANKSISSIQFWQLCGQFTGAFWRCGRSLIISEDSFHTLCDFIWNLIISTNRHNKVLQYQLRCKTSFLTSRKPLRKKIPPDVSVILLKIWLSVYHLLIILIKSSLFRSINGVMCRVQAHTCVRWMQWFSCVRTVRCKV